MHFLWSRGALVQTHWSKLHPQISFATDISAFLNCTDRVAFSVKPSICCSKLQVASWFFPWFLIAFVGDEQSTNEIKTRFEYTEKNYITVRHPSYSFRLFSICPSEMNPFFCHHTKTSSRPKAAAQKSRTRAQDAQGFSWVLFQSEGYYQRSRLGWASTAALSNRGDFWMLEFMLWTPKESKSVVLDQSRSYWTRLSVQARLRRVTGGTGPCIERTESVDSKPSYEPSSDDYGSEIALPILTLSKIQIATTWTGYPKDLAGALRSRLEPINRQDWEGGTIDWSPTMRGNSAIHFLTKLLFGPWSACPSRVSLFLSFPTVGCRKIARRFPRNSKLNMEEFNDPPHFRDP